MTRDGQLSSELEAALDNDPWQALHGVLESAAKDGSLFGFWWRDDDAEKDCAALARLFALAQKTGFPLSLATIPLGAEPALKAYFKDAPLGSAVLQHGYSHQNHAPVGSKKNWEFWPERSMTVLGQELGEGRQRLLDLFGDDFLPVLVPPWNRIAEDAVDCLTAWGFAGLSTFQPRPKTWAREGLRQVNCHIDVFQWKPARCFRGEALILKDLVIELARQATLAPDAREPIGIMTHHLVHDEPTWDFLERLFGLLSKAQGQCILSPRLLWGSDRKSQEAPGKA